MNFEEFFNSFYSASQNSGNSKEGCKDIPGGFQDLNPELFGILGTIVGEVMAGNMPFNVQNAVGNWLELVGQIILVYNAQQQYFQSGPGLYYNCKNKNINNSSCESSTSSSTTSSSSSSNGCNCEKEILQLKESIKELVSEIEELKREINSIKNR